MRYAEKCPQNRAANQRTPKRRLDLAVRNSIFDTFIYAKKFKQGYDFKGSDNTWLFVKGLTTPLEELIPNWIVIDIAILS
jgi:hypothetical protein